MGPEADETSETNVPGRSEIRVLVVDDDPTCRASVRQMLERSGMTVYEAGTLHEAVAVISCGLADILVLDFQLPEGTGMDVWDFARRENSNLARRTIVISGVLGEPERKQVVDHVQIPVLAKPVEGEVLLDMVERLARSV